MKQNIFYNELLEEINQMPVIDSHEHLIPEKMRLEGKNDFFSITMSHYASSDLISAGMPMDSMAKLRNTGNEVPFSEKVKLFMPYWRRTLNTGYCRALRIIAEDLYDISEINEETLPVLNQRMAEKNKPGLYTEILQERLNIRYCLWDQFWYDEPEKDDFFKLSLRLDNVVFINGKDDIKDLENKYKIKIQSPSDLEEILEIIITAHKERGLTAIKSGLAYSRTLKYEKVSKVEATLAMEKILRNRFLETDAKILQDYLMYSLAEKAYWHDLPFQIHTGLLEGNNNLIYNADPALLSELIAANPYTKFDLFHGGYPYGGNLSAMAKMFPNVYLDMAWTHIISPEYSKRYLAEWLDTVPICKIIGFGGDYIFVEGVYGHLKMAKENIAAVLAEKAENGLYSKAEAMHYALAILHDNAHALFSK